jgi:DNA mismatch endonuclease, patch repair protein
MDRVSKVVRSRNMAAVRSKGNLSTEVRLRCSLVGSGISRWRMNDNSLPGHPDFVFEDSKVAIFVDGCFWHVCPKCYQRPASSKRYWDAKAIRNINRDRICSEELRRMGWLPVRIWEHELINLPRVRAIIRLALKRQAQKREVL